MRPSYRFFGLAVALCIARTAPVAAQSESAGELLVMLQGKNLAEITAAAKANGARITHHLPIIDAIGAAMSRDQLAAIQAQVPDMERVIDDLAWLPEPERDVDQCQLAGAIELEWSGNRAEWLLFNKGEAELKIEDGTLRWPESLGKLLSARADSIPLTVERPDTSDTARRWKAETETGLLLEPGGRRTVSLEFERPPENPFDTQNQITLTANVDAECAVKLPRSYTAPRADTYFPVVSGAALLHSHGITGRGINVAVLDSGLWEKNRELSLDSNGNPRILARYDAIIGDKVDNAVDSSGHGTHMTSVLARSGQITRANTPQPSYRGIAPDAGIVTVKAFGNSGEAGFLDIVRGIQWVVENRERYAIRVLNLSFAARPRWPYWEDPVNQALMRAWKAGIFVAAAAGNEGPEPMTVGSPGNLPYLMTVGAVTDHWTEEDPNDDYIPDFSSRGPTPMGHIKPDVVALGGHMTGIVPRDSKLHRDFPEYWLSSGEFVMTGTSQATALVSGLAALLLQLEPEMSNDELKCLLITSAEPAIEEDGRLAYSPFVQGGGLVSVQRALTLGDRHCDQDDLDIDADIAGRAHFEGPAIFHEEGPPTLPWQAERISPPPETEGPSPSRRWGAAAHLQRLEGPPSPHPIDWEGVFSDEQRRIEALATGET
jgi:serine protease AprX